MSASLVGSEMCIRDRFPAARCARAASLHGRVAPGAGHRQLQCRCHRFVRGGRTAAGLARSAAR
eukprot:10487918-Alexandrium_andersonii.AAC.1